MSDLTKLTGHLVQAQPFAAEKPTVPGWYWWRSYDSFIKQLVPCIVEVVEYPGEPSTHWTVVGARINWSLGNTPGEWSGPIPMPTDAPAQDYYKAEEVEMFLSETESTLDTMVHLIPDIEKLSKVRWILDRLRGWS